MMQEWIDEFAGKKILIWGYGMEGKSTYRFIRSLLPDQQLAIADTYKKGDAFKTQIAGETVFCDAVFDTEIDFGAYDMIIKSPGIPLPKIDDLSNITGQAPLFLKHYRDRVIGVTGTKGKSTTTSLIAAVLNEKVRTHLVGNIGKACFDVIPELQPEDLIAFEISCHQLEVSAYSPKTAVYINLFEEHLDHYGSFALYGRAKDQIFAHQLPTDTLYIGEAIADRAGRADALIIGRDIYAEGKTLHTPYGELTVENCSLIGEHNYTNLATAYSIGKQYGVSDNEFLEAVGKFAPLAHRLQDLGEYKDIRFVDDSISTIGQSCMQAVHSLPLTDTVLVGGMDRGIDYLDLEEFLRDAAELKVVFMYATGKRILEELREKGWTREGMYYCEDLAQAVAKGKELTRPHHICLLSPAASSYDHFKNFEERGDIFRKLAFEL